MASNKVEATTVVEGNVDSTHDLIDTLTEHDIVTVAQRVTGDQSVSILKHHISCYSQDTLGMLGSHQNLTISVQVRKIMYNHKKSSNGPEEVNLFVKSVPYDSPARADFITSQGIFVKESLFFEKVIPFFMESYKDDKWAPVCYLEKKDVLVLENLKSQNYRLFDTLYDNLPAIKSVLTTLARFHSCSILAESRLNQMDTGITTLDQYWPNLFKETMIVRSGGASAWVQSSMRAACDIAEMHGHDLLKLRDAFSKIYEIILPSKIHCNVICHGDLWTNNVMIDDRSEPYKCVLVDFQIVRYAPLVLDILQLLHINTSRDFRLKYKISLTEYYHLALEETIKNNDPTGRAKIPKLKEISAGLDDLRLFGAIIACFYRLLGPKVATECSKSPEQFVKFLSGDVNDVLLSVMEEDQLFKAQIEEAINELAEISKQL